MKILTWNIERFKSPSKKEVILSAINNYDADIIVLTETHNNIILTGNYQSISTHQLIKGFDNIDYKTGENRVTIFTKYPVIETHKTYDDYTSICKDIRTPIGLLRVYGTIIGVFGGKGERFQQDLQNQLNDFERLFHDSNACIIGDLNTTFSGYTYPSHAARQTLNDCFKEYNLINLTGSIPNNVDHIVISSHFIKDKTITTSIWNEDKKLSDHIGICIEIM